LQGELISKVEENKSLQNRVQSLQEELQGKNAENKLLKSQLLSSQAPVDSFLKTADSNGKCDQHPEKRSDFHFFIQLLISPRH
jgi:hypothetical protein